MLPGAFSTSLSLTQGDPMYTLTLTTETSAPLLDGATAFAAARERQLQLLRRAEAVDAHPFVQQLTLAADQFIVERQLAHPAGPSDMPNPGASSIGADKTIIAGYHWFNDWGRDTMISLRGLTLATGRAERCGQYPEKLRLLRRRWTPAQQLP